MRGWLWHRIERQLRKAVPPDRVGPVLAELFDDYADKLREIGSFRANLWLLIESRSLVKAYQRRDDREAVAVGASIMRSILDDLRMAWRSLLGARGIMVAVILTLAVGTGANTAVMAVAYGILARPLPFATPSQLVIVDVVRQPSGGRTGITFDDLGEWTRRLEGASSVAGFAATDLAVLGQGDPAIVHSLLVTSDFFRVLGTSPELGRPLASDYESIAVVSDRYSRRAASVGRTLGHPLRVGGLAFHISGVMPPAFAFPNDDIDMWVPADLFGKAPIPGNSGDSRSYRLVARLKPGTSVLDFRAEANRVLSAIHPDASHGAVATVGPILDAMAGDARPVLMLFIGASALLLLVACANVASLLVGRAMTRRREMAIRLAVGAAPIRLLRETLAESVWLAAVGSTCGLLLAVVGLRIFVRAASPSLPRMNDVRIDVPVLLLVVGLGVVVTILSAMTPAIGAMRTQWDHAFRDITPTGRLGRVRGPLVVVQISVAIVLLTCAGLFARTVLGLLKGHGGVQAERVLTARLLLNEGTHFDAPGQVSFVQNLLTQVRALPGVESAAIGGGLPPQHDYLTASLRLPDPITGQDEMLAMDLVPVTAGYFESLGIRLERGRFFDQHDMDEATSLAILSEHAARDLWPKGNAIGRNFYVALPTRAGPRIRPRIVGVVSNVHYAGLDAADDDNVYMLWPNLPTAVSFLVLKTSVDPNGLKPAVEQTVHGLDAVMPLIDVRTLDEEMNLAIAGRELRFALVSTFAAVAFFLALVGLSAVVGRVVIERRKELAIRMALGASPATIVSEVSKWAGAVVAVGLILGIAGAMSVARGVGTLVEVISPYDPLTFLTVSLAVIIISGLACLWPLRRASRASPMELWRDT
jgi:putative ABC transport system permease protein